VTKRTRNFTGDDGQADAPHRPKNLPGGGGGTSTKGKGSRKRSKMVPCSAEDCDREFATERGAKVHKRTCPVVNAPPPPPAHGPVETKVRSDVEAVITEHPMGEALAEMAFTLARTLDEGAGLAVAAVNRELRANLIELAQMAVPDDDDFDDILSTPVRPEVRDEEEPG
jgi:hypothetical protein